MILTVLLIIAIVAGFYMAWNIGANDVANAMGTPVASGALTLRKAVIVAAVFEFAGAFFVGTSVSRTVAKGIVPLDAFRQQIAEQIPSSSQPAVRTATIREAPEDLPRRDPAAERFAIGMLSALLGAALWLNVATYFGQPVSTTHAIIGAVIGFAVVSVGPGAVRWVKMSEIAASWVISPVVGGLLAYIIYRCIQRFVLKARHPVQAAKNAVPLALGAVIFILFLAVLYKGPHLQLGAYEAIPMAIGAAVLVAVIARVVVHRRTRDQKVRPRQQYQVVESWFARIQLVTACYMAFSHGANDVANAIGPLAVAINGFVGGDMTLSSGIPVWLLVFGGVGIVVGLATFGYRVIEAVGKRITEITPTRGFSAEFGTATTVLVCSKLGLPISTTLVLVGAVMGVGLARGFGAIDMKVVKRIFMSWLITIPVSAGFAAVIYWILMAIYE